MLVIVGATILTTAAVSVWRFEPHRPSAEQAWLAQKYGPDRQSRGYEEWILRDLLLDRRGGVFVDIGAGDPREHSNTFFFEKTLGWSGLAVDAQDRFRDAYQQLRPRTRFEVAFVGRTTDDLAVLYRTPGNWEVASHVKTFTDRFGPSEPQKIRTVRLDDLLSAHGIETIDLLNIDVELAEPDVLAGFTVERFRPRVVCIEAHPEVRQQILDYFAERGYSLAGKYLRVDEDNLYFVPRGTLINRFPPEVEAAWSLGHH